MNAAVDREKLSEKHISHSGDDNAELIQSICVYAQERNECDFFSSTVSTMVACGTCVIAFEIASFFASQSFKR